MALPIFGHPFWRSMEILRQLQQQLPPFVFDIFRLCLWLVLLIAIFVPLERLCALHPQKVFRKAFFTDLGYYFLNGLLPKLLLATVNYRHGTALLCAQRVVLAGGGYAALDPLCGGADRWRIWILLGSSLDA